MLTRKVSSMNFKVVLKCFDPLNHSLIYSIIKVCHGGLMVMVLSCCHEGDGMEGGCILREVDVGASRIYIYTLRQLFLALVQRPEPNRRHPTPSECSATTAPVFSPWNIQVPPLFFTWSYLRQDATPTITIVIITLIISMWLRISECARKCHLVTCTSNA